jgi:hypothetical protein
MEHMGIRWSIWESYGAYGNQMECIVNT